MEMDETKGTKMVNEEGGMRNNVEKVETEKKPK
jgi:hypothetical protein